MQRFTLPTRLIISAALGAVPFAVVVARVAAQQGSSPAVFTAAQAQSGFDIYAQNCAGCHGADFEGSGDAPALAGGTFMLKWRTKMVSELFGEILQNMPPTNPGSLGEPAALSATAYILQRNGAQPASRRSPEARTR
jgi:mono/diheme cytochrome c family protein